MIAFPPSPVAAPTVTDDVVPVKVVALTDAGASGTFAGVIVGSGEGMEGPIAL